MNAFTNYLEKLGSNFLVSAMVPSLALVVISFLAFDPLLNITEAFTDPQGTFQLVGFGPLVFILTVIIGFTLSALNTLILKVFEGYSIPFPAHLFYYLSRRKHRYQASKWMEERQELKNKIRHLEKHTDPSDEQVARLADLRSKYYRLTADYGLQYPEDPNDILPTRFGNTLKAAENYAGERYGFDGVHFWPRLIHVIPSDYRLTIDHTRNELSFLVNMSILSFVFSCMCIGAVFYVMTTTRVIVDNPAVFFQFLSKTTPYFVSAAGGLLSFGFFYNASIFAVGSFGLMIRSSFDLFRMDLLKKLQLVEPHNSIEEFETWQNINELIVLGSNSLSYKQLEYRPEERQP